MDPNEASSDPPPLVSLSARTDAALAALFPAGAERERARFLLEHELGGGAPLPGEPTPVGRERVRLAALRVSDGRLEKLEAAVRLAHLDWRDLLVGAGFAHDVEEHLHWQPDPATRTPAAPPDGGTMNERLVAAGLVDAFDAALQARDRARLRALLAKLRLADPDRAADNLLTGTGPQPPPPAAPSP